VSEATRDRWVVETAERTMERLGAFDEEGNEYVERARAEYGEDVSEYRQAVLQALEDFDVQETESAPDA